MKSSEMTLDWIYRLTVWKAPSVGRIFLSPFKKSEPPLSHLRSCYQVPCEMWRSWESFQTYFMPIIFPDICCFWRKISATSVLITQTRPRRKKKRFKPESKNLHLLYSWSLHLYRKTQQNIPLLPVLRTLSLLSSLLPLIKSAARWPFAALYI